VKNLLKASALVLVAGLVYCNSKPAENTSTTETSSSVIETTTNGSTMSVDTTGAAGAPSATGTDSPGANSQQGAEKIK